MLMEWRVLLPSHGEFKGSRGVSLSLLLFCVFKSHFPSDINSQASTATIIYDAFKLLFGHTKSRRRTAQESKASTAIVEFFLLSWACKVVPILPSTDILQFEDSSAARKLIPKQRHKKSLTRMKNPLKIFRQHSQKRDSNNCMFRRLRMRKKSNLKIHKDPESGPNGGLLFNNNKSVSRWKKSVEKEKYNFEEMAEDNSF